MKIKFLPAIVSLLFITIAVSSCLDSNDDVEYGSDDTIRAFALDTIYGVDYKFTIDQIAGKIYNVDSLPVSADTIINKTLIKTLTTSSYYITHADTLWSYSTDSVDLSNTMEKPFWIKVHAADGVHTKEYAIEVRRHLTDPDSLVWHKLSDSFSGGAVTGEQKTVILKDEILVFASHETAYGSNLADGKSWSKITVSGLPADCKLYTLLNYKDALYIVTGSGKLFRSANGRNWTETSVSGQAVTLTGAFPDYIGGIVKDNGVSKFAITDANVSQWITGETAPASFPTENISATSFKTNTGLDKYMLMGKSADRKATIPWFSFDGKNWADLETTTDYYVPKKERPVIVHYNDSIYAFGEKFESFYTSVEGIVWSTVEKKALFPDDFKDREIYSSVVDKDKYIWIIYSKEGLLKDEVWKGRINRLGFD